MNRDNIIWYIQKIAHTDVHMHIYIKSTKQDVSPEKKKEEEMILKKRCHPFFILNYVARQSRESQERVYSWRIEVRWRV